MLNKISLFHRGAILAAVIFLIPLQLSYADYGSFTVNVPNAQGGYTAIVIKQSGDGFQGPQGEYYSSFPSVFQLQHVYGLTAPDSINVVNNNDETNTDQTGGDIAVTVEPPALPEYGQPDPPGYNYIWAPGYWAYNSFYQDYYWVPGTWVMPPSEGLLWTPGYWYWRDGLYIYSEGYWGQHVGFYGGINYGHGYKGSGKSSFNGGPGGTNAKPTFEEQSTMKEKHFSPTAGQTMHVQSARQDATLRASVNHGKPAIAATVKPGVFKGNGVIAAKQAGSFYNRPEPIKMREPINNADVPVARFSSDSQQSKNLTYAPKSSNRTEIQGKSLPAPKYAQQGTNNKPKVSTKEHLIEKQKNPSSLSP